jgi:hypothetical protein
MKRKSLQLFEPLIVSHIQDTTHHVPGWRSSIALGTDPNFILGGERRAMLILVFYALFHFSNTLKNTDCLPCLSLGLSLRFSSSPPFALAAVLSEATIYRPSSGGR